jgi:hypothetical protein
MVSPEQKVIIDRAKRIYAERMQANLERDHLDRYVAIEPESGDFFLGDTLGEAIRSAVAKYPSRLTHVIRIGHRAALHIGGAIR